MIGIAQARPPYIEFYIGTKPDPKKSVELGYRVTKDIDMVRIIQPGSRDTLEMVASEWLDRIKVKFLENAHDALPEEWIASFRKKYEMWKEGQEAPVNGTSIKEWPLLSPAQVSNLMACHILTIEDVAEMTEMAMQQAGMGSRELKTKASEWLKGKEISEAAMLENNKLKQEIEELKAQMAEFLADKPKRGRPKLEAA